MNFDRVAWLYSSIERLVYGRTLEQARTTFLPFLPDTRRVLCIGEGDGRFLRALLLASPAATIDVVEPSARMIDVARRGIQAVSGGAERVSFHCRSVLADELPSNGYDLVVSHFVLDVMTVEEVRQLLRLVLPHASGGRWLVSDFRECHRSRFAKYASKLMLTTMYSFFHLAAGMTVWSIPDYPSEFERAGMHLPDRRSMLGGFVQSELWTLPY